MTRNSRLRDGLVRGKVVFDSHAGDNRAVELQRVLPADRAPLPESVAEDILITSVDNPFYFLYSVS